MLRCAASFVVAAYAQVRLTPHDLRALPAELFTKPSNLFSFWTFYESINLEKGGFFYLSSGEFATEKTIYAQREISPFTFISTLIAPSK